MWTFYACDQNSSTLAYLNSTFCFGPYFVWLVYWNGTYKCARCCCLFEYIITYCIVLLFVYVCCNTEFWSNQMRKWLFFVVIVRATRILSPLRNYTTGYLAKTKSMTCCVYRWQQPSIFYVWFRATRTLFISIYSPTHTLCSRWLYFPSNIACSVCYIEIYSIHIYWAHRHRAHARIST